MAGPYAAGVCLGHRPLPPGRPGSALERWESIYTAGLGFRAWSPFEGIVGTYRFGV